MSEFEEWKPRPDPAISESPPPSLLRIYAHEQGRLPEWVFLQHQIWVDYWGNEHEIELMPRDYVENVIAFCMRRGEQIRKLVLISTALQIIGGPGGRRDWLLQVQRSAAEVTPNEIPTWLAELPLLHALNERLHVLDARC